MGGIASTNGGARAYKGGRKDTGANRLGSERPIDLLSKQEFRARFSIPDSVSILLVDGEPLTSDKQSHNAMHFCKEQFNASLCFPFPSIFKQFLHFTKIFQPSFIQISSWC